MSRQGQRVPKVSKKRMKECHHYEPGDPSPCANEACFEKEICERMRGREAANGIVEKSRSVARRLAVQRKGK